MQVKKRVTKRKTVQQKTTAKKPSPFKKTPAVKNPVKKTTVKKIVSGKKTSSGKKTVLHKVTKKKTVSRAVVVKKTPVVNKQPITIKIPASKKTAVKPVTQKSVPVKTPVKINGVKPQSASVKEPKKTRPLPFIGSKDAKPRYFFNTELPQYYNQTYLRAMPRDPQWLYLYWELSRQTIDGIKNALGEEIFETSKPILRVSDITDIQYNGSNAHHTFDVAINHYANNWYLKVPQAGRTYVVEYGFMTPAGKFYLVIASNDVMIPRDSISDIIDEEWTTTKTEELIRASTDTAANMMLGSSENRQITQAESRELSNVSKSELFPGASENLFSGSSGNL